MSHQLEHKARSAELHRRKAHLNRALELLPPDTQPPLILPSPASPSPTALTSAKTTATPIIPTTPVVVAKPTTTPATDSTTAKTTSTSSSATSTTSTSSSSSTSTTSSTSSSSTTSSPSTTAVSTTPKATVPSSTATAFVTFTPSASASHTGTAISSSSTSSTSSGIGAGSIVGAIFGTIGGVLVVAVLVAFIVRRVRKNKVEEEHFNASQFRRSAALIDDEFGNDNFSARPPTMIARHMAHSPALPPVSYGNYPNPDAYSADPYAATQFNTGDPYNQYNNNAYPAYTQEPVYTLNRANSFPPGNPISPSGSVEGMDAATAHNTYLNRQPTLREHDSYTHPAANMPQQYLNLNRVASPPDTPSSATPLHNPHQEMHNPHDEMYNPHDNGNMHNPHDDIAYPSLGAHAGGSAPPAGPEHRRPETVYDPEDAYGGM
ncbi:hypothetical protein BDP27DRAFT_1421956 [Rhodocollybia butyracea]|uniref:Uncharacterized protein n=1 Tax=Rhodocollybia butyracea TaxID=206335 RepID=A0A9P5PS98_9AGAR|nr:hypothetical protein BDP27DRAFT_1421956 [Rhodocollybia butyracea]